MTPEGKWNMAIKPFEINYMQATSTTDSSSIDMAELGLVQSCSSSDLPVAYRLTERNFVNAHSILNR